MANKKITDLNEATTISGTDWLVMVDVANDETKKIHANQVGGNIPIQDTAPLDPEEDDLWIDTSEPEEMQEAIVNEYSESANETYSCDYVNKLETYSTTEQRIGTWTDGKPIYRKVIDFGELPATQKSVSHNIENLDFIVKLKGISFRSLDNLFFPIPYAAVTAANVIQLTANATQITITTGIDRSNIGTCYVIIEYTKTTD